MLGIGVNVDIDGAVSRGRALTFQTRHITLHEIQKGSYVCVCVYVCMYVCMYVL